MSITRGDLRGMVQRRIGDSSGNFYGSTFYNDIIDSRVSTWAGKVAQLAPNYYLEQTGYDGVDDATDSTYEFYEFPDDYRTFVKLERQFGSGTGVIYQTLRTVNSEDQERYRLHSTGLLALSDSLTNYEQTVAVWDTRFRIVPAPVSNDYTYRLKYLRKPVAASADESLLDIPDEWGEVVVLDCCVFVLSQLGDPVAQGLAELRDREYKLLRDEYRRKTMDTDGMPVMERMDF